MYRYPWEFTVLHLKYKLIINKKCKNKKITEKYKNKKQITYFILTYYLFFHGIGYTISYSL